MVAAHCGPSAPEHSYSSRIVSRSLFGVRRAQNCSTCRTAASSGDALRAHQSGQAPLKYEELVEELAIVEGL
jgi:hypothetical protein